MRMRRSTVLSFPFSKGSLVKYILVVELNGFHRLSLLRRGEVYNPFMTIIVKYVNDLIKRFWNNFTNSQNWFDFRGEN